jgi:NAD-dependent dihydropyrimidine dehydrogenase PreA subunit
MQEAEYFPGCGSQANNGRQPVRTAGKPCLLPGPRAVADVIKDLDRWMDQNGYPDISSLYGQALTLFTMPEDMEKERTRRLGKAYREAKPDPDLCNGCGKCVEACWYEGISVIETWQRSRKGALAAVTASRYVLPVLLM